MYECGQIHCIKTPVYGCLKTVTLTLDHRNNNYSVDEKLSKLEISY